jgi:hypothetical protein
MKTIFLSTLVAFSVAVQIQAATINFDLLGTAGVGLLAGNQPGVVSGGSGGEIGAGITFNDVTRVLTVNVGWGSANGFTNLTSNVLDQHIHGPTASANGNGFTESTGVEFQLTRTANSPSSGTIFNNTVTLTLAQMTNLFNGKYYLNVHTANNGGGEIRGFLIAVPQLGVSITGQGGAAQANLLLSGVNGQKQVIQVSSNLSSWTPAATNTSRTNLFQFTESNPLQLPQRFYRAVVIP